GQRNGREAGEQEEADHDAHEDEPAHSRASASNASRKPSPSWLNVKTVMKIINDGSSVSQTWLRSGLAVTVGLSTLPQTCDSRLPQLGVGSLIPTPRNVMPASSRMFTGISSVVYTRAFESTCGTTCVRMIRRSLAPTISAASMNSLLRSDATSVRMIRAG